MSEHPTNRFHKIKSFVDDYHSKVVRDFNKRHFELLERVKARGVPLAGAAIVLTSVLASSPSEYLGGSPEGVHSQKIMTKESAQKEIDGIIKGKESLSKENEKRIAKTLSELTGLNLKPQINGRRLNEIYGYIGAEQHLYRWPGDFLGKHGLQKSGIAPLKGAFGDFDNEDQERYYIAAQLHLIPNWSQNWHRLKPWFRYRKVLVYNPDNGKSVVAVIGDAGPAKFTGKTFGGSPEVMEYLERVDGTGKGKVIVLFVDDKENNISLGPVIKEMKLASK